MLIQLDRPHLTNGMESPNWPNAPNPYTSTSGHYIPAGHADLDVTRESPKDNMIRKRDRDLDGYYWTWRIPDWQRCMGR